MSTEKILKINHFDEKSRSQVLSRQPVLSTRNLGITGVSFDYYHCDAHEAPVHTTEHHLVSVALAPNQIERKLDNVYRHEKQNFGSVGIIPARVEHWVSVKDSSNFALFSIQPETLAKIAPEHINPHKIELIPTFAQPEPDALIGSLAMAFIQQLEQDPEGSAFYFDHLNNALLAHLLKNYSVFPILAKEYSGKLSPRQLQLITDYINDNIGRDFKLTELAELINLKTRDFYEIFKRTLNISPLEYISQKRVARAKELFQQKKLSLADVAILSGFRHKSSMNREFYQVLGITAQVYRQKLLGNINLVGVCVG